MGVLFPVGSSYWILVEQMVFQTSDIVLGSFNSKNRYLTQWAAHMLQLCAAPDFGDRGGSAPPTRGRPPSAFAIQNFSGKTYQKQKERIGKATLEGHVGTLVRNKLFMAAHGLMLKQD